MNKQFYLCGECEKDGKQFCFFPEDDTYIYDDCLKEAKTEQ